MALIPTGWAPENGWVLGVNVGVVGGIPNRTTIFDDNGFGITASLDSIDNTGATDVSAAIQAALDSCISGQVVRLPNGDFRCDSTLQLGTGFSGKTFRGSGPGLTNILSYANQGINAGASSGYYIPDPPVLVTDGLGAGSGEITCDGDISYITAGSVIKLLFPNQLDPLIYSVYLYDVTTNTSPHCQVVKVLSKVGDVLEIFPKLYCDHTGEEVRVVTQSLTANSLSIEDMTVDMDNHVGAYSGILLQNTYGGWIKNVESINALNYGIVMGDVVNCEIRDCWTGELKGLFSNGAGLLFAGWGCFIENNCMVDAFPGLEMNGGSSGNVFSYNFTDGQWNTNHSPHNRFNYDEGNAVHHQKSDGYFGSESDHTYYRCLFYNEVVGQPNLNRFTRNTNVVGCLMHNPMGLGNPFIGSVDHFGTAQLSLGDPWRDYAMKGTLSDRISDDEIEVTVTTGGLLSYSVIDLHRCYLYWGVSNENFIIAEVSAWSAPVATLNVIEGTPPIEGTEFSIGPGSYGGGGVTENASYPELDLDVEPTTRNILNYRFDNNSLSDSEGNTLVDSLIYASEPSWWPGGMDWPPFDPETPVTGNYINIPAGLRFSESIPDAPPEITTPCTVTGTPVQGQTLTAVAGSVTGNPPPTRTWKWQRDGVDIIGATTINYLLVGDDVGHGVGPVQIETNSEGEDQSVAIPLTILPFTGDILVVTQVPNTDPVTELWLRGALTSGVSGPLDYYLVHHSGPYPTQPDNNFIYVRFGTPQDNVYVFQGTISEAEAIASVP